MSENEITCIIVDDELPAHSVLKHYINQLDFIEQKGCFCNAIDAYNYLRTETIDLILLDVNMPEIDGFSFIEMLNPKPMIIITTAHPDHAFKSYEYNAIDYLYKPIRLERFVAAIDKAIKWKAVNSLTGNDEVTHIEVKADGYMQHIAIEDIDYVESLGNYVRIHCGSKSIVTFMTTKDIEDKLPESCFLRIHKSYIVHKNKITTSDNASITLGDVCLPIGKTYKKHVTYLTKKEKRP